MALRCTHAQFSSSTRLRPNLHRRSWGAVSFDPTPSDPSRGGFSLGIVSSMAEEWGQKDTDYGVLVWAKFPPTPPDTDDWSAPPLSGLTRSEVRISEKMTEGRNVHVKQVDP
jgi:hypothetical protein